MSADRFGNPTSAYSFDGLTTYIEIPYDAGIDVNGWRSGTVATWFRVVSLPTSASVQLLRDIWDNDFDGVLLAVSAEGTLKGEWRNGEATDNRVVLEGGIVSPGKWHHAALVYDDGTATLYLDGAPIGSGPMDSAGQASRANSLILGATPGYTQNLDGDLDDVRLYDLALSDAEVSGLVPLFFDGFESGDLSAWSSP